MPAAVQSFRPPGVVEPMGGSSSGYALYINDNKLTYFYDYFGLGEYKVESTPLPTGKVELKMDFKYDGGGQGKGGSAML